MGTSDSRHWLMFNGEIYNYESLRRELADRGHRFKGHSDTEVLLAALQKEGRGVFNRCNGMWAVALWDRDERSLFLCRDRFGVKPLFYSFVDGVFSFASEAKALVGTHGVRFSPNEDVVAAYLNRGMLPDPTSGATFFNDVRSLPPGHWLELKNGQVTIASYYELPLVAGDTRSDEDIIAGYRELLTDSVRLRLHADVPVGTCLSGGLDSSSIVCLTRDILGVERAEGAQKTFSAVYRDGGRYDEERFMERVIAAARTEAHFIVPTPERFLADLERLVWHQDEPFTSTSMFAQWCVMAKVREAGVTVLLDGQGADEALAGYRPFDRHVGDMIARGAMVSAVREAVAAGRVNSTSTRTLAARALAWQLPASGRAWLRRRRKNEIGDWLSPRLAARDAALPEPEDASLDDHLRRLVREHSLPHLLRYEDRNSMAFSVEARVPFVDYRVMEYAFAHGSRLRIREGWTKWMLRRAMVGTVPDEIIWRRDKVGFDTPEDKWLAVVVPAMRHQFDDARSAPYLNTDRVRDVLATWPSDRAESRRVWRWINLEAWLRCCG